MELYFFLEKLTFIFLHYYYYFGQFELLKATTTFLLHGMATFVQSMTGQNLTFKVNFQCQEPCQSFGKRFFPFKNSSLGEHGVLLTFLYYSIFYSFNF